MDIKERERENVYVYIIYIYTGTEKKYLFADRDPVTRGTTFFPIGRKLSNQSE